MNSLNGNSVAKLPSIEERGVDLGAWEKARELDGASIGATFGHEEVVDDD
jgi:hypothetical protein